MPLSYTELSAYQLLCNKDVYDMIDTLCAGKFSDWNIEDFERVVVDGNIHTSYDEKTVRAVIDSKLRELDGEKPLKRYLEQGQHTAFELFLYLPKTLEYDDRAFLLFWAYMAREFGDIELPIEGKQCRELYISVLKKLNIRLYSKNDYHIDRFSIKDSYGNSAPLNDGDIREALFTIEKRNQAFLRKREYNGEPVFLEKAAEKFSDFFGRIYPHTKLKRDFNVHDLCFAIDSSCTELQSNNTLLLWGVFTGEPLNYLACSRKCGVSNSRIKQCENTVVRNTGHSNRNMIAERKD